MLLPQESTWAIESRVTANTGTVTLETPVIVIATTATEITAGAIKAVTVILMAGTTGIGAIVEVHLAGTRQIIVVAEATLAVLQEAVALRETASSRQLPQRMAAALLRLVGRRYCSPYFTALRIGCLGISW